LQITFTGTGTSQGIPVIACPCDVCQSDDFRDKRLRSSIHIQTDSASIVIDTGPDFRQQMLRENIKHLDAVVFTHEHKDHTAGLDDVRAFNFVQKKAMRVYATQQVQEALKREFAYAFADTKYPGVPEISLEKIDSENPFTINGVTLIPILVYHYKLPVLGFRIADFTYITDANFIPEEEKEKIKGSKVIVINALRRQSHISHFTLDEAITLMDELKPEKAYFTHISHQLGKHKDVSKELPSYIQLAYDGLKIKL
jgi:phosphoribosyl 1,2-cyclic phosphate phosphodiesterase